MKNNRIRLTSYIGPDLDELLQVYMDENNIPTKSQALERILIEFKYMKQEIEFLRAIISGRSYEIDAPKIPVNASKNDFVVVDKVKNSIDEIFSNMPD